MLQDGDSLSMVNDDALFGSGSANWNSQSGPTMSRNSMDNQIIYNRLHTLQIDGLEDNGQPNPEEAERTIVRSREHPANTAGARPKVNNTERTGLQANGPIRDGKRNKTVKNKENKSKNTNLKRTPNSGQNAQLPFLENKNSNSSPGWEPKLQYVNYAASEKKNGNSVKQKKQMLNTIRSTPDDQVCANDTDCEIEEYLGLPEGLDPNSDPRKVPCVYFQNQRPGHVIPPTPLSDSEQDPDVGLPLENGHHEDQPVTSMNRIHNNLWENSKNCNVKETVTNPTRNDVEMDTDHLMLANADLPGNSHLRMENIVQHFPGMNIPGIQRNVSRQNSNPNVHPPSDSQITVPYEAPQASERSRNELASFNLDSLQSNLPTDFLFGEGKNSDFYYAQQLQMEYDRENADFQTQRQYDTFTNFDYLNLTADQRIGNPSLPGNNSLQNRDPGHSHLLNNFYDRHGDELGDSLYVTTQNGETSDPALVSPDIRYDLPVAQHPDPSLSPSNSHCLRFRGPSLDDENFARMLTEELRMEEDEQLARQLQREDAMQERQYPLINHINRGPDVNEFREDSEPLYARFNRTWHRPLTIPTSGRNNAMDSVYRSQLSTDRPLTRRSDFDFLEDIHEYNPDFIMDDLREDSLVSINRDPRLLATLLMERAPDMMIPNEIDLNDYEALWELAEGLGEVRRVGMEQTEISVLPIHKYQGPTSPEDNKTVCHVCLSDFKKGEELRTLPCCHFYHMDCIDEWLKRNAICPVCRQPVSQTE